MNQPTYLIVSKNSPSSMKALDDLKQAIDIEPQLKVLVIEEHNEILPHHPSLTKLVKNKAVQMEKKPIIMPSIAHFNHQQKEFINHEGKDYLQFISNFIRDKKKHIMDQHLAHVNSHPPQIKHSIIQSERMANHIKSHSASLPVGHQAKSYSDHHDHLKRHYAMANDSNVTFNQNMLQVAKLQAQQIFDKTVTDETIRIEEFKAKNVKK